MCVAKLETSPRERIDIRSQRLGMPAESPRPVVEVVEHDDDDVGLDGVGHGLRPRDGADHEQRNAA
jgi:hypothetical protein